MIILGITGSIGMGKSTVANMLKQLGVPVHDADACVHQLLRTDTNLKAQIIALFPGVQKAGEINREALGKKILNNLEDIKKLEELIHPSVNEIQQEFITYHQEQGTPLIALDIPLLFECGYEKLCDYTAVVVCDISEQTERVLKREGMTLERLAYLLARQWPSSEKEAQADFVIDTNGSKEQTQERVKEIIFSLLNKKPQE